MIEMKVIDDATVLTTGDGKAIICVPAAMNGMNLTSAHAFVTTVSSSGTPTIQIRNVTQAADMLTTRITIDASEFTSYTAAAAPVVERGERRRRDRGFAGRRLRRGRDGEKGSASSSRSRFPNGLSFLRSEQRDEVWVAADREDVCSDDAGDSL